MFKYIFPKTNELSVFVITTVLYAMFFSAPEFSGSVKEVVGAFWTSICSDFVEAEKLSEKLKLLTIFVCLTLSALFYILGPLFLPFTKKDIRLVSLAIIWADAILLISWHFLLLEKGSWFRLVFIAYGIIWFTYSYLVVQLSRRSGINHLVDDSQASPIAALSLAAFAIVLALFLYFKLRFVWLDAYITSIFISLAIYGVTSNVPFRKNRTNTA